MVGSWWLVVSNWWSVVDESLGTCSSTNYERRTTKLQTKKERRYISVSLFYLTSLITNPH
ncbi:hypothetical protein E2P86_10585 [Sphingobacterium psychroaquaticum]|nr:hypothetical protein E2P86_10585 [Sphingobacterium psychroaquaticum]